MSIIRFLLSVIKVTFQCVVDFLSWLFWTIVELVENLIRFIGPAANSVKGKLNEQELYRVIASAASVGGGFAGFVKYILTNVDKFVNDPVTASAIQAFITLVQNNWLLLTVPLVIFVGDALRRKYLHGETKS